MRVSSEKQTLILAGETLPRRNLGRPLTMVATPADVTLLLAQGEEAASGPDALLPATAALVSYRNVSFGAADAYARTQAMTSGTSRTAIIDTYA